MLARVSGRRVFHFMAQERERERESERKKAWFGVGKPLRGRWGTRLARILEEILFGGNNTERRIGEIFSFEMIREP